MILKFLKNQPTKKDFLNEVNNIKCYIKTKNFIKDEDMPGKVDKQGGLNLLNYIVK